MDGNLSRFEAQSFFFLSLLLVSPLRTLVAASVTDQHKQKPEENNKKKKGPRASSRLPDCSRSKREGECRASGRLRSRLWPD